MSLPFMRHSSFFLVPDYLIKVVTPALKASDTSCGPEFLEKVYIQIGDEGHLRVGRRLSRYSVVRKGKVRGRECRRLRILYVHVLHLGDVAHATGDGNIALVASSPWS